MVFGGFFGGEGVGRLLLWWWWFGEEGRVQKFFWPYLYRPLALKKKKGKNRLLRSTPFPAKNKTKIPKKNFFSALEYAFSFLIENGKLLFFPLPTPANFFSKALPSFPHCFPSKNKRKKERTQDTSLFCPLSSLSDTPHTHPSITPPVVIPPSKNIYLWGAGPPSPHPHTYPQEKKREKT